MTVADQIINLALKQNGQFTRRDILASVYSGVEKRSEGSLAVLLNRMIADHKIVRIAYGTYRLNANLRHEFLYEPNDFMLSVNERIREKFPFVDYCIWQPSVLGPLMQHVPAVRMTLVDVEREAMESVFLFLQGTGIGMPVLLNPSKELAERYITTQEVIVIRPLVTEAPIETVSGCPVPTLEKMLVDAVSDKELQHLQGNELYLVFSNAFSDYEVRRARLARYASRRNRKEKVEQILNAVKNDTSR